MNREKKVNEKGKTKAVNFKIHSGKVKVILLRRLLALSTYSDTTQDADDDLAMSFQPWRAELLRSSMHGLMYF